MRTEKPLSTTLTLRTKDGENPSEKSPRDSAIDKIKKIKNNLLSIIKIIAISTLIDDEESENFLSSLDNYNRIFKSVVKSGLCDDIDVLNKFSTNPIKCWIDLLVISFVALHTLPGNKNIQCDVIGMNNNGNSDTDNVGICYSTILTIEAYDWKEHSISLFVPTDSEKGLKYLFYVDNEIKLFA